jgi:aryl-alcohol dehydrogenase-like predicted oxidoreductase
MSKSRIDRRDFVRTSAIAAAGVATGLGAAKSKAPAPPANSSAILNYNENMEYRRLGKTGLMVSAVCFGGHWKRVNVMKQDFDKNRYEVMSRCMEAGMNYVDACSRGEFVAYSKALKGRRDKMYLALSYCEKEVRSPEYRTADRLLENLDSLLKEGGQDHCDLWRITCYEPGGQHDFNTSCEIIAALEKAKQQGKARHIGISSHDHRWLKFMVEYFPQIEVILFPYTAMSKALPKDSLFDAVKKCDVGVFGIKPFASNSLFSGDSSPNSPQAEEDDRKARLAIRYILCNPAITAPIPGLINPHQVDNVAKAVKERRELDEVEKAELSAAAEQMWANLPANYQWLKNWQYV